MNSGCFLLRLFTKKNGNIELEAFIIARISKILVLSI